MESYVKRITGTCYIHSSPTYTHIGETQRSTSTKLWRLPHIIHRA